MSVLTDARKHAAKFALGSGGQVERNPDYVLGGAGIPAADFFWGADPSIYSPDEFGQYLLTSNPVYAVVDQRARYLSSLPLRLFRFTGEPALTQIPRSETDNEVLQEILSILDKTRGPAKSNFVRNVTTSMAQLHSGDNISSFVRNMGMEEVVDGSAFELLHKVNNFWTMTRLIRMTSLSRDIWGQSYWVANRGTSTTEEPSELWWVDGRQMRPIPHPTLYISHYEFDPVDGGDPIPFMPWEVIRIFNANPLDEFQPLSALASTRIYADHESASMQSNMNLHDNGLNPGAIVMPVNKMVWETDQARAIEEEINARLGGVDKAHRWGTFRQEVKIHQAGITPKDSEFIEGMNWDLEAVARAYDWPIDLLAGKRTYENVEMAFKRAWQTTAMEGAFVASDIAEFYLPMFDTDDILIPFFDTSNVAVLQETENRKWGRQKDQIDFVVTRNEWRRGQGLVPMEGGDQLYRLLNTVAIDVEGVPAEDLPVLEAGEEEEPELITEPASNGAGP